VRKNPLNSNCVIYKIYRKKELKRREREMRQFDSSAMGDLAFLLLIFFIVTSSFILRQGIFFSLPSKNSGAVKIDQSRLVEVSPVQNGFIIASGHVTRENLESLLLEKKLQVKDPVMIINMKSDIKYSRLIDTLSLARETGIRRVSVKNTE